MARNRYGQFVRKGYLTIQVTSALKDVAKEAEIRIRPFIRDNAEQILRDEIYASYRPATKSGRATQEYNDTHKHQKARPYHHTGKLASAIYATIEGDQIKTKVRESVTYDDGTPATKVYDILKYGTPKESNKKGFFYNNGEDFSPYISQEPHNFETTAGRRIDAFLDKFVQDMNSPYWRKTYGLDRYVDKVAKKYGQ